MADQILLDSGPSKRSLWRLAEMIRCAQSYAFRYELDRIPTPSMALSRGSIIHTGCAHFHARKRAIQQGTDPDVFLPPVAAMRESAARRDAAEFLPECIKVVEAYAAKYADDECEIWSVEEAYDIEIELPNGQMYHYTQRPDYIQRCMVGGRWRYKIVDIKSTSKMSPDVVTQYAMTLQMLSYRVLGYILFGEDFDGVVIDVVCWTEVTFKRATLDAAPMMVRRFPQIIQDAEEEIERLKASGRPLDNWPRQANAENCLHRYGKCPYWDACAWGAEELGINPRNVKVKLAWIPSKS